MVTPILVFVLKERMSESSKCFFTTKTLYLKVQLKTFNSIRNFILEKDDELMPKMILERY